VIALCEWLLSLLLLLTVFGLHIAGDPTPLIAASVLYAFCVASFGVLIGSAIPNQAAAIQAVALGGFLLVFLLSGLIFPVENIPAGLRWISNIVWGKYYIVIVRDALLQGGGWAAMWFPVLMIALIGAIFFGLAWLRMRAMQVEA
jgi:ABC-2 type transport system permease protein